jgi:hypothetical protein
LSRRAAILALPGPTLAHVRIGTWNLEGRWSPEHERVLTEVACDVWLLTENDPEATLPGYHQHLSAALMGEGKHWAGILSRWPMRALPDPHPATVGAEIAGQYFWCSVLPWTGSGLREPWDGADHPARVESALRLISPGLVGANTIWGGDWNQPLLGNLSGFSRAAQGHLTRTIDTHGLQVPTRELPGRSAPQFSIDHIAIPGDWIVSGAGRTQVSGRVSDHDVYWVEVSVSDVPKRPDATVAVRSGRS